MTTDPYTATDKQKAFIARLLTERDVTGHDRLVADATDETMSKQAASSIISQLLSLPEAQRVTTAKESNYGIPSADALPSGRYAIDNADGELRFYRVWRGTRNPDYVKLYVLHGPDESEVPFGKGAVTILKAIADDAGTAAVRYGHEIGQCSVCNLRLTNRVSRALGIGPICGGRFYADEWKSVVHGAREQICAMGLDPDENVEEGEEVVRYDVRGDFTPDPAPTIEQKMSSLHESMTQMSQANATWDYIKDALRMMTDAELDAYIALLTREQEKRAFAQREAEQERAAYEAKARRDQSFLSR